MSYKSKAWPKSWFRDDLISEMTAAIAPRTVRAGSGEWGFWRRRAEMAVDAMEHSKTHALVLRSTTQWWIWDEATQRLVLMDKAGGDR